MNINTWKKLLAIALGMLLLGTACAFGEEAQTLSADALNEANALSALRKTYTSLLVDEIIQMDDMTEQQTLWDGTTSDGRSLQVMLQTENQRMIFVLDGTFYEYDLAEGTLYCCAWLPGSQEAFAANWDAQLQIFADELSFVLKDGNAAVAELLTVGADGTVSESWQVDAETHALQGYTCEARLTDENGTESLERYILMVTYNAANYLTDDMLNTISDETFTLTLVDERGNKAQQQLPVNLPIRFTDGENHLLFFRDAAFETPVDRLDPAAEDLTNGVTLYYSNKAE